MSTKNTRQKTSASPPPTWHSLPVDQVFRELNTDYQGLKPAEITKRQEQYGRNELPSGKETPLWAIILRQFMNPLIYILIAAGILSLVMREWPDAGFIFAIILFNAALGAFQEGKAEKSATRLKRMLTIKAEAIRDGESIEVDAEELVPGDIIRLEAGRRVPADARVIRRQNLSSDEALLTGESMAQQKTIEALSEKDLPISDRKNCVFAGTTITRGGGLAVVYSTGLHTELGSIAREVGSSNMGKTPLIQRMEEFTSHISYALLGLTVVLVAYGFFSGIPIMEVFFIAVALAVAAIPEGLPIAMTVALSIATERMVRRNVIVRKLAAVEGLGSCTLIASDKTGTLTQNRQSIQRIVLANSQYLSLANTPSGHWELRQKQAEDKDGEATLSAELASITEQVILAGVLCNTATRNPKKEEGEENDENHYHGDPVDVALLVLAERLGKKPDEIRRQYQEKGEIPFESEIRFAAKFFKDQGGQHRVYIKGATDTVTGFCDRALSPEGETAMDRQEIEKLVEKLSAQGYRVIALADGQTENPQQTEEALNQGQNARLRFLGLVGMIDPLRPEAKDAVNECKDAGVRVVMITGDHPATAFSIARELGIAENQDEVRHGQELTQIAPENGAENEEFVRAVNQTRVFARVSPLQKLEIVKSYVKKSHFVAVTGDGVNDAPALRHANIGVAMGSGTDVTKDTASIIVTDDNFASIVSGIEEGRFAYANVRKVVYFLVSTAIAAIVLISFAMFLGTPLPLTAVQILWLNFATSSIQDIGLAFEAGEEGVLKEPPRNPDEKIFDRRMMEQTILAGSVMGIGSLGLWFWLLDAGFETASARNLVLLFLVLLGNFHVFNCRSESRSTFKIAPSRNWILVVGVIAAQGVHIGMMYIPFMQNLLSLEPVSLDQWLLLLALASSVLIAIELYKAFCAEMKPQKRHSHHAQNA